MIKTYGFTEPFIERVADTVIAQVPAQTSDFRRVAVVFGGRRPQLFLKRTLGKRLARNFLSPAFFTIDEFMAFVLRKHAAFTPMKDLDHCYALFQLARTEAPDILKGRETFAAFLPWAREILAFIDQLDLENIPDARLKNIGSQAAIGYDVPDEINRLLEKILILRRAYHEYMGGKNIFSRGFQYLQASEKISETRFDEFDKILFCGFFYFTATEAAVVRPLFETGKADLLFQGDGKYWPVLGKTAEWLGHPISVDGPLETVATLRNFGRQEELLDNKSFKIPSKIQIMQQSPLAPPQFDLKLYSAADMQGQAGMAREILKTVPDLNRTVVVLPSSDAIVPLLSEVGSVVADYNISMGYPLKRSSLYTLVEYIFHAQMSRKGDQYYTRDYLRVLRHPFVKNLDFGPDPSLTRIFIHKIEEVLKGDIVTALSGNIFITLDDILSCDAVFTATRDMAARLGINADRAVLTAALQAVHRAFFESWASVKNFDTLATSLRALLDLVVEKSFMSAFPLNIAIAERVAAFADELLLSDFRQEEFPAEDLYRIFENKMAREMVAFTGSPLKGLQILGLFETRSLQFDHVVVLDANEGVFPNLKVNEPLIPRDVMVALGINRLELEEEIQRYQFMRLLAGAKDVHLIYLENREKERSRFVEQLVWMRERAAGRVGVVPVTHVRFSARVSPMEKAIRKTPAMMEALKAMTFSASSINTYLNNPMDFYWQYVLGLREKEDLLDEPEDQKVGRVIHEILEEAFRPFVRKKPLVEAVFRRKLMAIFDRKFSEHFSKSMRSDAFLLKAVMAHRLERFWEREASGEDRHVEELVCVEQPFEDSVKLSAGTIKFKYIVDRIDRLSDGTILILDYKTGSRDQMPQKFESIAAMELSRETIAQKVKSFQLPLYYAFLARKYPGSRINAAYYSLRTTSLDYFIKEDALSPDDIHSIFLRPLDFVISEIFNPAVPFIEAPVAY